MLRIKRVKQGPPGRQVRDGKVHEVPGTVATHYAAAIHPRGLVERWTANSAQAVPVTEDMARRVVEFYASRPNVGQLTLEGLDGAAVDLSRAVVADTVSGETFRDLQEVCRRLEQALKETRQSEATLAERSSQQEFSLREANAHAQDLGERLAAKDDRIAALEARIAEMEAAAAAALVEQAPEGKPEGRGKKK